eukprot:1160905-Pelagomonas_calceolata.AAC.8
MLCSSLALFLQVVRLRRCHLIWLECVHHFKKRGDVSGPLKGKLISGFVALRGKWRLGLLGRISECSSGACFPAFVVQFVLPADLCSSSLQEANGGAACKGKCCADAYIPGRRLKCAARAAQLPCATANHIHGAAEHQREVEKLRVRQDESVRDFHLAFPGSTLNWQLLRATAYHIHDAAGRPAD